MTLEAHGDDAESTVVGHVHDDEWTLMAAQNSGSTVEVETTDFSEFFGVTVDLGAIVRPVGDFIAQALAGRSEPASCDPVPDWAQVTALPSGAAHTCVRAGENGAAEVELKSNRGLFQQVQLPSDMARRYVWVEDQPEWLRALIAGTFGHDAATTVMLPAGKRMTVGYDRPSTTVAFDISAFPSSGALLLGYVLEGIKYLGYDDIEPFATISTLQCFDALDLDLNAVAANSKVPSLGTETFSCALDKLRDIAKDRSRAISEAAQFAPGASGADLSRAADRLQSVGRFAVVLYLAGAAARIWTQAIDAAVTALGVDNADAASVTLSPGLAECSASSLADAVVADGRRRPNEVRDVRCADGWATAVVVDPETGDTDGLNLFRRVESTWEALGDLVPGCPAEAEALGAPPEVAAELLDGTGCEAPAYEGDCEPVGYPGGVAGVSVSGAGCDVAVPVVDRFLNDPTLVPEGSGGFVSVDGWSCQRGSATLYTCETPTALIQIYILDG